MFGHIGHHIEPQKVKNRFFLPPTRLFQWPIFGRKWPICGRSWPDLESRPSELSEKYISLGGHVNTKKATEMWGKRVKICTTSRWTALSG